MLEMLAISPGDSALIEDFTSYPPGTTVVNNMPFFGGALPIIWSYANEEESSLRIINDFFQGECLEYIHHSSLSYLETGFLLSQNGVVAREVIVRFTVKTYYDDQIYIGIAGVNGAFDQYFVKQLDNNFSQTSPTMITLSIDEDIEYFSIASSPPSNGTHELRIWSIELRG